MEEFIIRIGTFFVVLGIGIFILFITTDYIHQTNFDLLFWAIISFSFGLILRRRKGPPKPSGRFERYRKWREGSRKSKEEKGKK